MSANALQIAVVARLTADSPVLAITGPGRIFDRLSQRKATPCLVLADWAEADWSTGDSAGSEHRFVLEAWSDAEGRRQVAALADAVKEALAAPDLDPAGMRLVSLRHERTVSRRDAKSGLFVARMTFRVLTES